jgi:hypothetical protein
MNRQMRRASTSNGRKLQSMSWNAFEDITIEAKSFDSFKNRTTEPPDIILKNNKYIVQIYHELTFWGPCDRAMIRRSDAKPNHSWSDLQRIKNEIWGSDRVALEVYPRDVNLVDVANLYWLWVFPADFECPIETKKGRI